jgi:hypothetical protein
MARVKVPLPRFTYRSISEESLPETLGAKLIDCYIDEFGIYRKRPGAFEFSDVTSAVGFQGIYFWREQGKVIAVNDGNVYEISNDSGVVDITGDTLNNQVGSRVSFATDGSVLVMCNGGELVVYTGSGTTTNMSHASRPTTCDFVAHLDGYLLVLEQSSQTWYYNDNTWAVAMEWGGSNDGTYDAETMPDDLQYLDVRDREISLFGDNTIEVWYNDGVGPFSRHDAAYIERGIHAQNSCRYLEGLGTYMWLDNNKRVVMLEGRRPVVVSTPYDDVIRDLTSTADARAISINIGNREFYILTFPIDDLSIVFDSTTSIWSDWGHWNTSIGKHNRFKFDTYCNADTWGLHLVGSNSDGKIYKMGNDYKNDGGDVIRSCIRSSPVIHGGYFRKRSNFIEVRLKRSQGVSGTDIPKIFVRWRDDNRPNWSNDHELSLGAKGDSDIFLYKKPMGIYKSRQYEFIHTNNTDFQLVSVEEDIEQLEA